MYLSEARARLMFHTFPYRCTDAWGPASTRPKWVHVPSLAVRWVSVSRTSQCLCIVSSACWPLSRSIERSCFLLEGRLRSGYRSTLCRYIDALVSAVSSSTCLLWSISVVIIYSVLFGCFNGFRTMRGGLLPLFRIHVEWDDAKHHQFALWRVRVARVRIVHQGQIIHTRANNHDNDVSTPPLL
jgi:hypothetical protein